MAFFVGFLLAKSNGIETRALANSPIASRGGLVEMSVEVGVVFVDGAFDRVVDFSTVDGDFLGGLDSQPNFIAPDLNNDYGDLVIDYNAFVCFSRQN